ncbi:porin [Burkholderia sp. Ac-20353]|uniref:porin n=1 Tax=Burkholderia sp. Ac-20353 TaxID=2703894 RepID=UPI00197BC10E|nr:porin [Burkholderia sp. Ac-20353]MBN3785957.1 porin [Burkholderia sp. Ac-20353]
MKSQNWVLCCACLVCPTFAHAETSVSLSGRVDAGAAYLTNVRTSYGTTASRFSAQSGDWGTSMLNLSGTEDLGGGNRAFFFISQGFNAMNGVQASSYRKSFLGMSSDSAGSIRFGRDLFIANGVAMLDPFVQQLFSSGSLVRNRNGQKTSNNISYQSPAYYGFDLYGQFSFGNQAGNFNGGAPGGFGRSNGLQLTYRSNAVAVRAIYDEMRDSNGRFSNVFTASREYILGGMVNVGDFTVQAVYTRMDAPDTPPGLAHHADHAWLGGNYRPSPELTLTAAAYYVRVGPGSADATHDGHGHAALYELGATYNLSKRTFLYVTAGYVRNSDGSTFSVEPNAPGANNGNFDNPPPGHSQTGVYAGVNHAF